MSPIMIPLRMKDVAEASVNGHDVGPFVATHMHFIKTVRVLHDGAPEAGRQG